MAHRAPFRAPSRCDWSSWLLPSAMRRVELCYPYPAGLCRCIRGRRHGRARCAGMQTLQECRGLRSWTWWSGWVDAEGRKRLAHLFGPSMKDLAFASRPPRTRKDPARGKPSCPAYNIGQTSGMPGCRKHRKFRDAENIGHVVMTVEWLTRLRPRMTSAATT